MGAAKARDVLDAMVTALQAIDGNSPYNFDVSSRVYTEAAPFDLEPPFVQFLGFEVATVPGAVTLGENHVTLTVELLAIATHTDNTGLQRSYAAMDMAHDVHQALEASNRTLGIAAATLDVHDVRVESVPLVMALEGAAVGQWAAGAQVVAMVQYRTTTGI